MLAFKAIRSTTVWSESMKNEAEAFMSVLTTLKLCWAIHKYNEAVSKCVGLLKRKFKEHLAYIH